MTSEKNDELIKALLWRYATNKFDPVRKIDDHTWSTLEQALLLSPSSYGLQPWKFIIVKNPELRTALKAASWNQAQITDASHLVVFAAKEHMDELYIRRYIEKMAVIRSTTVESFAKYEAVILRDFKSRSPENVKSWAARQCYIALGQVLTAAAMLGVDACPIEGIVATQYDDLLGLTGTGYYTCFVAAFGFRDAEDTFAKVAKVRFGAGDVVEVR
ncbi:MAG: NAD(P)H-dependent oxidoreductase [Proteobacteria bacterium]|nr:MAG: NAD(P)H-dependent oxidoreductase [Pseudomonadota bacterium]